MQLPQEGNIFQDLKGQKKLKFEYFATFCQFSQNRPDKISLCFCIQLLGDAIDQLPRD